MRSEGISPINSSPAVGIHRQGRRSAWLWTGLGVVLLSLVAAGVGCTPVEQRNGEETELTALPQEVRDALDRAAEVYSQPLSGARWSKVFVLKKSDHPLYQLQGTNDRNSKVEMEVTGAGRILEDLIAVLHLQAKELEKLVAHVEQVTTRLPEMNDLSVVRSELAALLVRVKKLSGREGLPGMS